MTKPTELKGFDFILSSGFRVTKADNTPGRPTCHSSVERVRYAAAGAMVPFWTCCRNGEFSMCL